MGSESNLEMNHTLRFVTRLLIKLMGITTSRLSVIAYYCTTSFMFYLSTYPHACFRVMVLGLHNKINSKLNRSIYTLPLRAFSKVIVIA